MARSIYLDVGQLDTYNGKINILVLTNDVKLYIDVNVTLPARPIKVEYQHNGTSIDASFVHKNLKIYIG